MNKVGEFKTLCIKKAVNETTALLISNEVHLIQMIEFLIKKIVASKEEILTELIEKGLTHTEAKIIFTICLRINVIKEIGNTGDDSFYRIVSSFNRILLQITFKEIENLIKK